MLFLIIVSLFLFTALWEKNAIQPKFSVSNVETENTNSGKIYHIISKADIELYFPNSRNNFQPNITKIGRPYNYVLRPNLGEITNTETSLKNEHIKVESYEATYWYGNEEIYSPIKETNLTYFPTLPAYPMTKNSYIIKWSYEIPENESGHLRSIELNYWTGTLGPNLMRSFNSLFPQDTNELIISIIFYLLITTLGLGYSAFLFRKQQDLKTANKYFYKDFNSEQNSCNSEKLSTNLRILTFTPNLFGSATRIIFGLSILLFKSRMNSQIKNLQNRSALRCDRDVEGAFAKYLENSDSKLSDLIPEQKTLMLALGFFASVGISFSWNFGAMTPLLFSLALFYVFLNLGSTIYLLRESRSDQTWILVVIFGLVFALLLPQIIETLRNSYVFHYGF